MKIPPYLKKGDKIGIVATARKISRAELQPAVDILKQWGLEPVLSENIFGEDHQFSGTDEQRAADLQRMLDDDSIRAVISARGGYGTLRIIDKLDLSKFIAHPKWVVGYSDITVLHSHLHALGIATLHATMPINFAKHEEATGTLRTALFGGPLSYFIPHHHLNREGKAEGETIGGNLSLLYALAASKSDTSTHGKILFIEDLDEYLYHIDRMMLNLKRSGKLSKLKGLIIGGFTDMKDNPVPFGKTAEEIIREAVEEYDYPVCFGFPAGHIEKNCALPFGTKTILEVNENASVKFIP
ncbi:MAG TPA: LD-carboxypeptidase [Bacteroidia bacterium]|jgi:muramoyltetrapeptide carboxypeptidase